MHHWSVFYGNKKYIFKSRKKLYKDNVKPDFSSSVDKHRENSQGAASVEDYWKTKDQARYREQWQWNNDIRNNVSKDHNKTI